ncbi:hypothetical protein LWI28_016558 [Acer negundo]|uniref:Uncharacterized protein n=1 Tax=Acer negundo TaxID=4023 RepID=A0AAD5IUF3_ACENE|nr:hypothetical protein LWI28_016558 [Acer negundo]
MPDIDTPPDYDFDPPTVDEDEPDLKQSRSDLFVKHMKKVRQEDGSYVVACNYFNKVYKWSKSEGYDTYRKHIQTKHPEVETRSRSQTQIPRVLEEEEEEIGSRGILLLKLAPPKLVIRHCSTTTKSSSLEPPDLPRLAETTRISLTPHEVFIFLHLHFLQLFSIFLRLFFVV